MSKGVVMVFRIQESGVYLFFLFSIVSVVSIVGCDGSEDNTSAETDSDTDTGDGGTIWTLQEIDTETDNCVMDGFGDEPWCRCIAEGFSKRYSYDKYLTEIKWSSDTTPEDQAIFDQCNDLHTGS